MKKYVIKNIKRNIYYRLDISNHTYHFVFDIRDAKVFDTKKEANAKLKQLSNKDVFEVINV